MDIYKEILKIATMKKNVEHHICELQEEHKVNQSKIESDIYYIQELLNQNSLTINFANVKTLNASDPVTGQEITDYKTSKEDLEKFNKQLKEAKVNFNKIYDSKITTYKNAIKEYNEHLLKNESTKLMSEISNVIKEIL